MSQQLVGFQNPEYKAFAKMDNAIIYLKPNIQAMKNFYATLLQTEQPQGYVPGMFTVGGLFAERPPQPTRSAKHATREEDFLDEIQVAMTIHPADAHARDATVTTAQTIAKPGKAEPRNGYTFFRIISTTGSFEQKSPAGENWEVQTLSIPRAHPTSSKPDPCASRT